MPDNDLKTILLRRFVAGSAWTTVGKLGAGIAVLGVNFTLARLLTPEAFGVYFLSLSVVLVAAVAAQFGMARAVVRLVAEDIGANRRAQVRGTVFTAHALVLILAASLGAVFYLGLGKWLANTVFEAPLMAGLVGLIAVWTVLVAYQNTLAETFRGFHDIRSTVLFGGQGVGLVSPLLTLVGLILLWLVWRRADLADVVSIAVAATAVSIGVGIAALRRRLRDYPPTTSIAVGALLALGWPLWLSTLLILTFTQADLWVLGALRGEADVAVYGAAAQLAALMALPFVIVHAATPASIAELYVQGKRRQLETLLRVSTLFATLPAAVLLLVFMLFGAEIMSLLYGEYYAAGAGILAILAGGHFMSIWTGPSGIAMMMTGHQATMMIITLLTSAATLGLAILVGRSYGAVGIAWVFAVGFSVQNLLMWVAARVKMGIWTHVSLARLWALARA